MVDDSGGSTVWQEPFKTEAEALSEVRRTIKTEGIRTFEKGLKEQCSIVSGGVLGRETEFRHVQRRPFESEKDGEGATTNQAAGSCSR